MSLAQEIQKKFAENYIFIELDWINKCIESIQTRHLPNNFNIQRDPSLLELVYSRYLQADLNIIGQGSLPPNIIRWHDQVLKGYHVLQIDEVINIGESVENRYKQSTKRTLKMCLTDGKQKVFALEYKPIPSFSVDTPAGTKILVWEVLVRRGTLLLMGSNVKVLGGRVKRLVEEAHKAKQNAVRSLIPEEWLELGQDKAELDFDTEFGNDLIATRDDEEGERNEPDANEDEITIKRRKKVSCSVSLIQSNTPSTSTSLSSLSSPSTPSSSSVLCSNNTHFAELPKQTPILQAETKLSEMKLSSVSSSPSSQRPVVIATSKSSTSAVSPSNSPKISSNSTNVRENFETPSNRNSQTQKSNGFFGLMNVKGLPVLTRHQKQEQPLLPQASENEDGETKFEHFDDELLRDASVALVDDEDPYASFIRKIPNMMTTSTPKESFSAHVPQEKSKSECSSIVTCTEKNQLNTMTNATTPAFNENSLVTINNCSACSDTMTPKVDSLKQVQSPIYTNNNLSPDTNKLRQNIGPNGTANQQRMQGNDGISKETLNNDMKTHTKNKSPDFLDTILQHSTDNNDLVLEDIESFEDDILDKHSLKHDKV